MGKLSLIASLILGPVAAASITYGVATTDVLNKTKLENEDLNKTNITIKAENETLTAQKQTLENQLTEAERLYGELDTLYKASGEENTQLKADLEMANSLIENLKLRIAELETQIQTMTITEYTLANKMMFVPILEDEVLTIAEARAKIEEFNTKCSNGEAIYKDYVFTAPLNTNANNVVFIYTGDNFRLDYQFRKVDDENVLMQLQLNYTPNVIKLLNDLSYEVGNKYELVNVPECLETMEFECIEKTEETIKFKTSGVLAESFHHTATGKLEEVASEEIPMYIILNINENEITIGNQILATIDIEGNLIYAMPSTNTITLNRARNIAQIIEKKPNVFFIVLISNLYPDKEYPLRH